MMHPVNLMLVKVDQKLPKEESLVILKQWMVNKKGVSWTKAPYPQIDDSEECIVKTPYTLTMSPEMLQIKANKSGVETLKVAVNR